MTEKSPLSSIYKESSSYLNQEYIFTDLNVRDKFVTTSEDLMLKDTKVVVQSVWRLLTTEVGEIPNFRSYGLSIKRFLQYPLSSTTAEGIYEYVKNTVSAFENRAEIIKADVSADFDRGQLFMVFYLKVKSTGEVVVLPTWTVQVAA